jgi:hypothetical protein
MSAKNSKPSFKPDRVQADKSAMNEDKEPENMSGRVKFDDRGNAVWEWAMATGAFGRDVSPTAQLHKIEHPGLSIADDAPPPADTVRANPLGMKKGYDPYDSGKLAKERRGGKKDLRKLSEWLKLKKQAEENKKQPDDPEEP